MIRPYKGPQRQPINQPRIGNILDPLGDARKWTNVWGAVMNVPQPSGGNIPVSPTPTPSITPTNTPTPSVTPTNTVTPTPTITPTGTLTPTPTITPSSSPSVFTPASISDLAGWWYAGSGVTTSGGLVTDWDDISPSYIGNLTKQAGTSYSYNSSGFGVNSTPYIRTTTGYYESSNNWSATTASTVFVVCSFYQNAGGIYTRYLSTSTDYPSAFTMLNVGGAGTLKTNASFSSDLTNGVTPSLNTPSVLRVVWNGSSSKLKLNNGSEVLSTGVLASQGDVKFRIGYSNPVYSDPFDIAEVIIYNKVLNATELTNMNTYLNTKYGITL